MERQPLVLPEAPNQTCPWISSCIQWPIGRIKCLTVVDDFIKECLDIPVANGISDDQVARTLDAIAAFRDYHD